MYIRHINHVTLYAKNFYAHSNDVVEDLKNMVLLDHGFRPETDDKLYEIITNDYKTWIKSLPNVESFHSVFEEYKSGKLETVAWCDDKQVATIWHILITYASHIPLFSGNIKPPFYGMKDGIEFKPQYNITERIFKNKDLKNNMREAYMYINKTHPHIITNMWNTFIKETDYSKCKNLLAAIDVVKTEEEIKQMFIELKNEFFKKYKEDSYMPDNKKVVYPDGRAIVVKNEWFVIYTRIHLGYDEFSSTCVDAYFIPNSEKHAIILDSSVCNKPCSEIVERITSDLFWNKPDFKKHYAAICQSENIGHYGNIPSEETIESEITDTLRNLVHVKANYYLNTLITTDGTATGGLIYTCKNSGYVNYEITLCPHIWINSEYVEHKLRSKMHSFMENICNHINNIMNYERQVHRTAQKNKKHIQHHRQRGTEEYNF